MDRVGGAGRVSKASIMLCQSAIAKALLMCFVVGVSGKR